MKLNARALPSQLIQITSETKSKEIILYGISVNLAHWAPPGNCRSDVPSKSNMLIRLMKVGDQVNLNCAL